MSPPGGAICPVWPGHVVGVGVGLSKGEAAHDATIVVIASAPNSNAPDRMTSLNLLNATNGPWWPLADWHELQAIYLAIANCAGVPDQVLW